MTLASSLEDFSLAELFRMLEQGRKSGCLTVSTLTAEDSPSESLQYIWFRQGRVIAVANNLDGKGLISLISQRGWLTQRVIERLNSLSLGETPLGLTLKTQGALQAEQLNLLFTAQIQQIWALFDINTGGFQLNGKAPLPSTEMTGLSISAMEVALAGLRNIKNWQRLTNALPAVSSAIKSLTSNKPQLRLNTLEIQLWELAKGTVSLDTIAKQLNQPIAKIEQAAFRLMVTGIVEEVPLASTSSTPEYSLLEADINTPGMEESKSSTAVTKKRAEPEKSKVSQSFLQNLVGFLRSKA